MYTIHQGDCLSVLKTLPECSVQCCVTSPPYWGLRDYGHSDQIGLERDYRDYIAKLVEIFREVRRVLRDDGVLWLNLGDSYVSKPVASLKQKDLAGIPWRVALAMQDDGWWLRQDIIWAKKNPMPESITDRCTKAHEYIFLFSKTPSYYYNSKAIAEPAITANQVGGGFSCGKNQAVAAGKNPSGNQIASRDKVYVRPSLRNKRSVWSLSVKPFKGAHFAVMPSEIVETCLLAGTKPGDTVLDPFAGAGTTLFVAEQLGRDSIGIEINEQYIEIINSRLSGVY